MATLNLGNNESVEIIANYQTDHFLLWYKQYVHLILYFHYKYQTTTVLINFVHLHWFSNRHQLSPVTMATMVLYIYGQGCTEQKDSSCFRPVFSSSVYEQSIHSINSSSMSPRQYLYHHGNTGISICNVPQFSRFSFFSTHSSFNL